MKREPMTPAEFDARCRDLIDICPWLSETSGRRSVTRNTEVGGNPKSKHVLGMARDFVGPTMEGMRQGRNVAQRMGLWTKLHDVGSGDHLHVQGLPPGPVAEWWNRKFNRE